MSNERVLEKSLNLREAIDRSCVVYGCTQVKTKYQSEAPRQLCGAYIRSFHTRMKKGIHSKDKISIMASK